MMPVQLVQDYADAFRLRRAGQKGRTLVGGALIVAGLLASMAAILLALLFGLALTKLADTEPARTVTGQTGADLARTMLRGAIVCAVAAGISLLAGFGLLRRDRHTVLFLRRFGHREATEVVSFAAAKTIGTSWRLVTLDDAAIVPMGVGTGTRVLFRSALGVGGALNELVHAVRKLGIRMLYFLTAALWVIFGLDLLGHENWSAALLPVTLGYYETLTPLFEGRLPDFSGETDLHQAFLTAVAIIVATWAGYMILATLNRLLWLLLTVPTKVFSSSAKALEQAEEAMRAGIRTHWELDLVAAAIDSRRHRVLAPRLVVLKTGSDLWRETVRKLASLSSVALVDVSEPTENLLWEVQLLRARFGSRWILVGHYDEVCRLGASVPGSIGALLAVQLDGQEILTYTTDRRGRRRFARALRAKLQQLA